MQNKSSIASHQNTEQKADIRVQKPKHSYKELYQQLLYSPIYLLEVSKNI